MKILKSFGKALYDLRVSKNVSLEKISQITKINQEHFEQFEKGNFHTDNEVYIRLFLREYIKCIDSLKMDDIMDQFNRLYYGTKKKNLIFIPDTDEIEERPNDDSKYAFNVQNYTPKNIAVVITTFLIILFVFRLVIYLSSTN